MFSNNRNIGTFIDLCLLTFLWIKNNSIDSTMDMNDEMTIDVGINSNAILAILG